MDAVSAYSFASCAWNALQAISLLLGPQLITALLTPNSYSPQGPSTATREVEDYLAQSLGLAQLALGLVTVVLTGSVPLGSPLDTKEDVPSPYAPPVLLLTTLHHAASAFHCWARYTSTSRTAYSLGFTGSTALAAFGIWCLLFGGEKARVSRRTGADKRTSGFPFRNAWADRRKAR
ncbi:hypothetical protein F4861DRAFT_542968 [Xylaria intraflava]|nr:hypothetical protein F4861DRAFT_542968 [Xylaria intraflava]